MKIGLVGESPNDTVCIQYLLEKEFPDLTFITLIKNITGAQLDQVQPTKRLLRKEYEINKPDVVLFIRDLDGLAHHKDKVDKRKGYFAEYKTVVDRNALFCLIIYEIEAYILADIEKFNKQYDCEAPVYPDPCSISEPKEELKKHSKRYSEGHNIKIFPSLDNQLIKAKCLSFSILIRDLKSMQPSIL